VNALIVDTSSWISYFKGTPQNVIDLALKEGRIHLPPIVAAELLSSRLNQQDRMRLEDFLKELPLCETPFQHWSRVGELRATLAIQGLNASTPDAHVAQCALDLDGYLVSEDAIFKKISALTSLKVVT
jgi:hypothetical protein